MEAVRQENDSLKLEMEELEPTPQPITVLPDLYAARDKVLDNWKVTQRKESKQLLYEFATKFIEQIVADDTGYTFIQRLLSDLQQERKFQRGQSEALAKTTSEYDLAKKRLRNYGEGW